MDKHGQTPTHLGCSNDRYLDPPAVLKALGLPRGAAFLDVGAGEGRFSFAAAAIVGPGGRVYAVDVREECVAAVRKGIGERGLTNVEAHLADVAKGIPLPAASIDFALVANVLHEFVENHIAPAALRELARVLKPGGTLAVVDFYPEADTAAGPPKDVRLAPAQAEALLAGHGFRKVRLGKAGPYHYALVMGKS